MSARVTNYQHVCTYGSKFTCWFYEVSHPKKQYREFPGWIKINNTYQIFILSKYKKYIDTLNKQVTIITHIIY